MKMQIGKVLCGFLLCGSVFAQDITVRETRNINIKIGDDTYYAVYDKTNDILVVTKNKSFRLGPLIPPKKEESEVDRDSVDATVSEQPTDEGTNNNPLDAIMRRGRAPSR
jgi:hypothetical protein